MTDLKALITRLHRPPPLLLRLTSIRPPALNLLVPAQTRAQADINPRRRAESKALRHLDQIQLMHIEDGPERVRSIRLEVGSVSVFGGFVEVVVFSYQGFELGLDVCGALVHTY